MKIIYNKIIPFKGFGLLNILGLIFSRVRPRNISIRSKRHEYTHTLQQYELLILSAIVSLILTNYFQSWWFLIGTILLPFAIYVLAFILRLLLPPYGKLSELWMDAYKDTCFEREAYANEMNENYHLERGLFAEVKYIFKKE